jgi:ATP-dependent HslUV protease ATP-binding subunit HslU
VSDASALTPRKIVQELDHYIVGQQDAKRIVAIALRNRWRRQQLSPEDRAETPPKNIMLIGPTGVGKTEIARRMAGLVQAPFLKVEATKYTEIGYVGRNVDSMIRDLVETSISMVRSEEMSRARPQAEQSAEDRLVSMLAGSRTEDSARIREDLRQGRLDNHEVELTVEERQMPFMQLFNGSGMEELGVDVGNMFGMPPRRVSRRMTVKEARRIVIEQESEKAVDREKTVQEGLRRAQELGIVFIDEIDKIISAGRSASGPEVSREGVQRDLLPIVEGASINTRYGTVRTDHILFIAAGAFSTSRPTDLIPELQGRFPLRAELKSLTQEDFVRILSEPKTALTKQYRQLLATENIDVEFAPDGVKEMAAIAYQINSSLQDIGARRLHTVIEKVLDDISFQAPEIAPCKISITSEYVRERLKEIVEKEDLRRYIL